MEHSVHLVIPAFNRRKIDLSVKDAQSDVLHSWVLLAANVRLEAHQMQTAVYVTSARLDDSRQMAWSAFPTSIATQTLRVRMYQTVLWGPLDAWLRFCRLEKKSLVAGALCPGIRDPEEAMNGWLD